MPGNQTSVLKCVLIRLVKGTQRDISMVILIGYVLMDIAGGTIVEKPAAVVSLFFFLLATAALFYPEEETRAEKRLSLLKEENARYRKTLEVVKDKKPEDDGWCRAAKFMKELAEGTLEKNK